MIKIIFNNYNKALDGYRPSYFFAYKLLIFTPIKNLITFLFGGLNFAGQPINKKIFLLIETKSQRDEIVTIPCKKDIFIFFIWFLYIFIAPIFYINMFIFFQTIDIYSISLHSIFSLIFISFSLIYGLSMASLNLLLGNKYNSWKMLRSIMVSYSLLQLIVLFLACIILACIIINLYIYLLGLSSPNLVIWIWLRLNLLPLVIYSLYAIRCLSLYISSSNKKIKLDFSLFSPNMLKAITFNRFLVCGIGVCSGYSFKSLLIFLFSSGCDNQACASYLERYKRCEASLVCTEEISRFRVLIYIKDWWQEQKFTFKDWWQEQKSTFKDWWQEQKSTFKDWWQEQKSTFKDWWQEQKSTFKMRCAWPDSIFKREWLESTTNSLLSVGRKILRLYIVDCDDGCFAEEDKSSLKDLDLEDSKPHLIDLDLGVLNFFFDSGGGCFANKYLPSLNYLGIEYCEHFNFCGNSGDEKNLPCYARGKGKNPATEFDSENGSDSGKGKNPAIDDDSSESNSDYIDDNGSDYEGDSELENPYEEITKEEARDIRKAMAESRRDTALTRQQGESSSSRVAEELSRQQGESSSSRVAEELSRQQGESSSSPVREGLSRVSDQSEPLRKGPRIKYIDIKPGEMEDWEKKEIRIEKKRKYDAEYHANPIYKAKKHEYYLEHKDELSKEAKRRRGARSEADKKEDSLKSQDYYLSNKEAILNKHKTYRDNKLDNMSEVQKKQYRTAESIRQEDYIGEKLSNLTEEELKAYKAKRAEEQRERTKNKTREQKDEENRKRREKRNARSEEQKAANNAKVKFRRAKYTDEQKVADQATKKKYWNNLPKEKKTQYKATYKTKQQGSEAKGQSSKMAGGKQQPAYPDSNDEASSSLSVLDSDNFSDSDH